MRLDGPYRFEITIVGADSYAVRCSRGGDCFHAPVTTRSPKLYVFAQGDRLLYIGQTVQGMAARMRLGFQADGTGGYYGYRWRTAMQMATCHVWCLLEVAEEDELHVLECIESEVVFAYRKKFDQWPPCQTEIHFHASDEKHRAMALTILNAFPANATQHSDAADRSKASRPLVAQGSMDAFAAELSAALGFETEDQPVLRTFIQIAGLILTLEAAIFLAKGNLGLSAEVIAQLSTTKWGHNSDVVNSLVQQRADTWVGVLLLILAFALQMGNALWPMRFDDDIIHRGAVLYALVFCAVLGFGAFFLSRELAAASESRVKSILATSLAAPTMPSEPSKTMEPTQ